MKGTGKGDPLATGYTDYGSLGEYRLTGSASQTSGSAPIAALSATPTTGTAPVTVSFSSTGSSDADGSIVAYEWNFGDGSPVATTPSATHTYTAPGTYTATLKVTDNSGLSGAQSTTITVQQPVATTTMHVSDIGMT